ncbi:MAG: RNA polymerase sigma-70 factor [Fulvivirga sp.]|uniref:RNA polymerase sigma factor n=1 Tax=Fulvivirga sp. TaxID=1931237 RepID=UPI0032ED7326
MLDELGFRLLNGDEGALKMLYEHYKKRIFRFCVRHGQTEDDAKDVLQEVIIRIWTQRSEIDPDRNLESYIFSIAKNVIVDKYRELVKRKVATEYQIYLMTPENDTEAKVYLNELKVEIEKTFDAMPEMRKLVFQLSRFKGYSNKEIAQEMGISIRTVESHISKALQAFKNNLGEASAGMLLLLWSNL